MKGQHNGDSRVERVKSDLPAREQHLAISKVGIADTGIQWYYLEH